MPVEPPQPTIREYNCRIYWVRDENPPYGLHAETVCQYQSIAPKPLPPVASPIRWP
jgi:hypothetical protein